MLLAQADRAPEVVAGQVAGGPPADRVVAAAVEEAHQDVRERRLARAARTDDEEPFAGAHVEVDAVERVAARRRPLRGHIAQAQPVAEIGAHAFRRDGLRHEAVGKLGRDGVGDALGRGPHLSPRRGGHRHGGEDLEHGHRDEDHDRERGAGQRAGRDTGRRDKHGERPRRARRAATRPRSCRPVRPRDASPRGAAPDRPSARAPARVLGAVRDQHLEAAEVVGDRVRELGAQRRDGALGLATRHPAPDQRGCSGRPAGSRAGSARPATRRARRG